jgi:hypothetical protein
MAKKEEFVMRIKVTGITIFLLVLLMGSLTLCAQQAQVNNEKIRELRAEIKKREAQDIPADLRELNLNLLMERRAQLRTVLRKEIDSIQKYKAEMGASISPEESQKIESLIRDYEAEIQKLAADMQRDLAAASSGVEPPRVAPSQPAPSNLSSPMAADVLPGSGPGPASPTSSITDTVPSPVASPTPSIIKPVSAGEGTGLQPTQRTCVDLSQLKDNELKTVSQLDQKICDLVRVLKDRKKDLGQARLGLSSTEFDETPDFFDLLVAIIAKKSTPAFLVEAEESRVDKQVGSGPSSGGSTSLVVKGGAPAILGFAVENGALTQSVDKTTITFRGNPLGIYHALANKGFFQSAIDDENDPLTRFLRKTSFAFSFDANRGAEPGTFTGTKQQLSSFSARIEFINKRKPILYLKEWNEFLNKQVQAFTDTLNNSTPALLTTDITSKPLEWRDPALQQWFADTQASLASAASDQIESVVRDRLSKLPVADLSPATLAQLNGIEEQIGVYLNGRDEVLDKIARGTLVTFEYTNNREVSAPDTSNFRFIAEKGPGGRADMTFNGSLTIFNKRPSPASLMLANPATTKTGRVRDFQFAGQLDLPFGSVRDAGQFVFFASGRYERLMEDASTAVGTIMPNTKGDIAVAQFGLKIPIKGLGMKFPISITFANRTELIKEREVRGNFGFTFDLDTIFAKFKPF